MNHHQGDIILITGANSGVGFALAQQLLQEQGDKITLCLGCRNIDKAKQAKASLLSQCSLAKIDIIQLDVSSVQSVLQAAIELKVKYSHINYLFLNAGIMPVTQFQWSNYLNAFKSFSSFVNAFTTGEGLLVQADSTTKDGLQTVFSTNLFGHYLLIKELEDYLAENNEVTRIIWTSSNAAKKTSFSLDNIQHKNGKDPYGSSKHAIDLLNVSLNEELNSKGIYSHITCPGLVLSNLTYGIMPANVWLLLYPIILLTRFFLSSFTITAVNGSTVLRWLYNQNPTTIDYKCKYYSRCSVLGNPYVEPGDLPVESASSNILRTKLDGLIDEVKSTL